MKFGRQTRRVDLDEWDLQEAGILIMLVGLTIIAGSIASQAVGAEE